jgi:hypothetical protein
VAPFEPVDVTAFDRRKRLHRIRTGTLLPQKAQTVRLALSDIAVDVDQYVGNAVNRRVDRLVSELHVFDEPVDGSDVTTVVVYCVVEVAESYAVEILPIDGPSVAIQNFGDFLLVSEGHGQAPVLTR